jgi:hypothetical protein
MPFRILPRKSLPWRSIIRRNDMLFRWLYRRKAYLSTVWYAESSDFPQKSTKSQTSWTNISNISRKILNYFLTFIRALSGVDSWKKRDQKISCYSPCPENFMYSVQSSKFLLISCKEIVLFKFTASSLTAFVWHTSTALFLTRYQR